MNSLTLVKPSQGHCLQTLAFSSFPGHFGCKIAKCVKESKDITNFTATTPLQLEEVSAAGKQLLSFGVTANDLTSVLRQLGDTAVENLEGFQKALVKQRLQDSVVLLVQRGNQGYYITVEL